MKFGTRYCTYSSNVFQTKIRKRKKEKKEEVDEGEEMEKGDKKMRDEKMGDCPHNQDAGPKFPGGGGGQGGSSQLKGKHCSRRLRCYNMRALKEIKEIKGRFG